MALNIIVLNGNRHPITEIHAKFRNCRFVRNLYISLYLFSMPERLLVSNFMRHSRVDYVIIRVVTAVLAAL